jgi:hypothetical protein
MLVVIHRIFVVTADHSETSQVRHLIYTQGNAGMAGCIVVDDRYMRVTVSLLTCHIHYDTFIAAPISETLDRSYNVSTRTTSTSVTNKYNIELHLLGRIESDCLVLRESRMPITQ